MPLHVQVVNAEEELFSGSADFVLARSVDGDLGILPGHIPVLVQLDEHELKIRTAEGERSFPVVGGFMTVKDDRVIVLAEEKLPEEESPG